MAAAQDQAGGGDHAVGALLARQPRILLDAVDRHFGSAAEDREHRAVFQEIDRVVTPFAVGDHASIEIEDTIEFETVECYPAWRRARSGVALRCAHLAWISLPRHHIHATPPVIQGMIFSENPLPRCTITPRHHDRADRARL